MSDSNFIGEPKFLGHTVTTENYVADDFLIYDTENFAYVVPKEVYGRIVSIPEGSVQRQSEAFAYAYLVVRKADKVVTKSRWF